MKAAPEGVSQLPLLASLAHRRRLAAEADLGKAGEEDAPKGTKPKGELSSRTEASRKPKAKLKAKKGAPQEVSSRRAVAPPQASAAKLGAKAASSRARDPRFDDMSGKLDMDSFASAYSFLEEYRQSELDDLKQEQIKLQRLQKKRGRNQEIAAAAAERESEVQQEIKRRIQQDKQRKRMGELEAASRSLKAEEREKVRTTGKVPFFHKKGAVRKIVAQRKKEAKKGGDGRNKEEERREKKLAGKEKKRLPTRRVRE